MPARHGTALGFHLLGGRCSTCGIPNAQQHTGPQGSLLRRRGVVTLVLGCTAFAQNLPTRHLGPQQAPEFQHSWVGLLQRSRIQHAIGPLGIASHQQDLGH